MFSHPHDRRRRGGYSSTELLFALAFLGADGVGADAIGLCTDDEAPHPPRRIQAEAIAASQMEFVNTLPLETLAPTQGFEAAAWECHPGLPTGSLPVVVRAADGTILGEDLYRVSLRVEMPDANPSLRKLAVRVTWEDAGVPRRHRARVDPGPIGTDSATCPLPHPAARRGGVGWLLHRRRVVQELAERVAVITGAASGIGRGIAEAAAANGCGWYSPTSSRRPSTPPPMRCALREPRSPPSPPMSRTRLRSPGWEKRPSTTSEPFT